MEYVWGSSDTSPAGDGRSDVVAERVVVNAKGAGRDGIRPANVFDGVVGREVLQVRGRGVLGGGCSVRNGRGVPDDGGGV